MQPLYSLLWVMIGGAIGAAARFGVSELVALAAGRSAVPMGTLLVNVAGCLLIGYVAASFAGERQAAFSLLMNRPLVVTGFLGALTTFSTFGFEVVDLALRRGPAWAAALAALHVVLSLAAVVGGMRLGE